MPSPTVRIIFDSPFPPAAPRTLAKVGRTRQNFATIAKSSNNSKDTPTRRVVVTGQGVVTSLGHDPDEFYNNLLAGVSGITQIQGFDTTDFSTTIAGEIKHLDCEGYILKKWERRIDNVMKYMSVAGKKALGDAGLKWDGQELKDLDRSRCGILIGTAMGGMNTFAVAVEALSTNGYKKMNPFCIPFAIQNMGGAMLAMDLGFMGPNYPIATACATGNYCIWNATQHIIKGDADLMLAGGSEASIVPSGIGGFIACKALSKRNEAPEAASRPWDQDRDGFVMGEGAGVLVLEELEHAQARGAPILAEVIGGAYTCDAHHMTEPHPGGDGVVRCIEIALEGAGITADHVRYVNAHGTSTPAGDMAEYRAITKALPHPGLKINSSKGMIGHLLGAAGAVEAVATIQAMRTGWVHPNLNLDTPEEGVDLNVLVGREKEKHDIDIALSNSFGFGGHDSCLLFKKWR